MLESLNVVIDAMPYILVGFLETAGLVFGAMGLGLLMGVPLAVGQVYGNRVVRFLVGIYVWFFRGVPVVVLLLLFYFGLFSLIGLNLSAFASAAMVLGLTSAAYQSQIFRGSIQSLPQGQFKAAQALGMSNRVAITSIILPQALRFSIPGWSNEYSIILKDSAVAFVIGVTEIMARTHFVASRTFEHLPLFIAAGLLYYVLTYLGVTGLRKLEKKVRIAGYSH
ncbi:amino acid ABC transporter permease [Dethiosulfatarculus sandiegensis]|uniref:Amino acid ABC transporter permease n=1 Tax=Dethiosulfatarculus sandiegensis TaxID=1429043 RepID=A0A0D2GFN9_9BACT|nr:amino acid ABC transporter permease [Dethiosulfatarculus sandiegensis]KIX13752.1 amino acid ABC transporter permease [Dethiosulfatarculus sandiegensis]